VAHRKTLDLFSDWFFDLHGLSKVLGK